MMLLDDFSTHPQAKPSPCRFLGGKEWLKDAPSHILCHSTYRVRHRDTNSADGRVAPGMRSPHAQRQGSWTRHHSIQRVADQVGKKLPHLSGKAKDLNVRIVKLAHPHLERVHASLMQRQHRIQ